ncbi:hypothetical protein NKI51_11660 [Mesorhizobium australicum]|uniref:hypothetical protein n=1 Tax=Mesorhizobium australicum TaxID=536018 RepID=UPI00333736EB
MPTTRIDTIQIEQPIDSTFAEEFSRDAAREQRVERIRHDAVVPNLHDATTAVPTYRKGN